MTALDSSYPVNKFGAVLVAFLSKGNRRVVLLTGRIRGHGANVRCNAESNTTDAVYSFRGDYDPGICQMTVELCAHHLIRGCSSKPMSPLQRSTAAAGSGGLSQSLRILASARPDGMATPVQGEDEQQASSDLLSMRPAFPV